MEDGAIESETIVRAPLVIQVREREEVDDGEDKEREKRQKLEEEPISNNTTNKQGSGGGLLDNLISKLSSPRAPKPIDVEAFEPNHTAEHDVAGDDGTNGGGGVIKDFISNFFNKNEGEDVKDVNSEERRENHEESEIEKKGVDKESEGGSISNGSILSNLVPDGVAPASDEASILIHSVVHD